MHIANGVTYGCLRGKEGPTIVAVIAQDTVSGDSFT